MSRYRDVFGKRHTFIAVVHVRDEAKTIKNVRIALDGGADGVFLVNHHVRPQDLLRIYEATRQYFATAWLGINMLGMNPVHVLERVPEEHTGIWSDNAGIYASSGVSRMAEQFLADRRRSKWYGLYFGGVAFKGQGAVAQEKPGVVAKLAIPYVDVVTTSGPATGFAPSVEKIREMKRNIGGVPLVIASGITPENFEPFIPWSDGFLTASGVSNPVTDDLEPTLVRALADGVAKHN